MHYINRTSCMQFLWKIFIVHRFLRFLKIEIKSWCQISLFLIAKICAIMCAQLLNYYQGIRSNSQYSQITFIWNSGYIYSLDSEEMLRNYLLKIKARRTEINKSALWSEEVQMGFFANMNKLFTYFEANSVNLIMIEYFLTLNALERQHEN